MKTTTDEKIKRFYISLSDAEQDQERTYYFKLIQRCLK